MAFRSSSPSSAHLLSCSSSSSSCRRGVLFRTVLGVLLLLSLSSATPVSHPELSALEPFVEGEGREEEEAFSLLALLRSLLNNPSLHNHSSADDYGEDDDVTEVKRGFGIAGLDNVDMITSTLDRSRAMSRARHGRRYLTSGLTFKELRALMERAG